jgi:deoxyribose-phosphate aldolase
MRCGPGSVDAVAVDVTSSAGRAVADGRADAAERTGAAWSAAGSWLAEVATSDAGLRQVLHGLPGVDQVGAEARAASLATRSIKKDAKLAALDLAVRMVDLTTLEGADTPGKVRGLCAKAVRPDPADGAVPSVAAVCVYPDLVRVAKAEVDGSAVAVASVATAFPSGRASLAVKLADVAGAVAAGADEVDMVIDRGAFLAGRYGQVYEEVRTVKEACGSAHLKVILETGELATLDNVSRASWLAMLAGADFIKTSTGKISPASTPPVALVMLAAVRDFERASGRRVGVKVAGGIRTAKDAIRYLVLVNETTGPAWLTPDLFRIGASSLLNDLLMQRRKQLTGQYAGPDYFTVD